MAERYEMAGRVLEDVLYSVAALYGVFLAVAGWRHGSAVTAGLGLIFVMFAAGHLADRVRRRGSRTATCLGLGLGVAEIAVLLWVASLLAIGPIVTLVGGVVVAVVYLIRARGVIRDLKHGVPTTHP